MPKQSPSQTIGPFFAIALTPRDYGFEPIADNHLANESTPGERIRIEGRVFDGRGMPVPDALIDLWQADHNGEHLTVPTGGNEFTGFGRCATDAQGRYHFATIKPGRVDDAQAAHASLAVFARGIPSHAFTRVYFSDEPANDSDPILSSVEAERRKTLIARRDDDSAAVYRFDIHLQGESETVFFDA
jgi:protocatechuate 3,4-dioxygenase alpha subunit